MAAGIRLILIDFFISFIWVCSGPLNKLLVYRLLGLGLQVNGEVLKGFLSIMVMFFFAWLGKITKGGAYNPLTVLAYSVSNFEDLFLTLAARIPTQVLGSIAGVSFITHLFPQVTYGPRLSIDLHQGALTEGLLVFTIVVISLWLKNYDPNAFFMKTWISSVCKLALNILGSDLTGGIMNPASAAGWAYIRGDHRTKEHLYVYWIAPLHATLLGVWVSHLLNKPKKQQKSKETKGPKEE